MTAHLHPSRMQQPSRLHSAPPSGRRRRAGLAPVGHISAYHSHKAAVGAASLAPCDRAPPRGQRGGIGGPRCAAAAAQQQERARARLAQPGCCEQAQAAGTACHQQHISLQRWPGIPKGLTGFPQTKVAAGKTVARGASYSCQGYT